MPALRDPTPGCLLIPVQALIACLASVGVVQRQRLPVQPSAGLFRAPLAISRRTAHPFNSRWAIFRPQKLSCYTLHKSSSSDVSITFTWGWNVGTFEERVSTEPGSMVRTPTYAL
ncbi:unnamed protein product [Pylaiella littoralis]